MKINGIDFTIGADPEVFVKRFGRLVSAHDLIPGSKEKPFPVNLGAVQPDGMAAEFNIDPAGDWETFDRNMTTVLGELTKFIPGYELFIEPVADFGSEYIAAQPKDARELGCNPDFNAYTKQANPRPDADMPFRTASGHVHIGWTKDVDPFDPGHLEACYALAKAMDLYVGIPSMPFDPDNRRRQLYGKAGSFRPKSYGMEYRVLSNKWINNPFARQMVYHNTLEAIKALFESKDGIESIESQRFFGHSVQSVLNQEVADWETAVCHILTYGGVKSVKHYREQAAANKK